MNSEYIKQLQDKIIKGLEIASKKLVETKRKENKKVAISVNGEIKIIVP